MKLQRRRQFTDLRTSNFAVKAYVPVLSAKKAQAKRKFSKNELFFGVSVSYEDLQGMATTLGVISALLLTLQVSILLSFDIDDVYAGEFNI